MKSCSDLYFRAFLYLPLFPPDHTSSCSVPYVSELLTEAEVLFSFYMLPFYQLYAKVISHFLDSLEHIYFKLHYFDIEFKMEKQNHALKTLKELSCYLVLLITSPIPFSLVAFVTYVFILKTFRIFFFIHNVLKCHNIYRCWSFLIPLTQNLGNNFNLKT